MERPEVTPTPFRRYCYRPLTISGRIFVWLCGRFGHGKMRLIEEYTRNVTYPPRKAHETWPVKVTVVQGKWRCRCCHNVSVRAVEMRTNIIDKAK